MAGPQPRQQPPRRRQVRRDDPLSHELPDEGQRLKTQNRNHQSGFYLCLLVIWIFNVGSFLFNFKQLGRIHFNSKLFSTYIFNLAQ
jgi:hypothetical protein